MIKKILKNDLFIRIVALVCAIVLWFFVMAEVDPETTVEFRHIPIILEGINILEDKNLIILDGAQSDVNISLRGPISVIAKLSKENITAVVPAARVMSIVSAGLYGINFDINIENGSGVTIIGKSKYINICIFIKACNILSIDILNSLNILSNFYRLFEHFHLSVCTHFRFKY